MNGHQRHLGLVGIAITVQISQQRYLLQEIGQQCCFFLCLFTAGLYKVLHATQKLFQILLTREILRIRRAVDVLADATLHDDAMPQHVGILLLDAGLPPFYQLTEDIQFSQRSLRQLQVENDRLLDHLPQTDIVQMSRFHNLSHRSVADASCRIVDDTSQSLFIVRIGHHTEVGDDILDFFALIEAQSAIDTVWDTVLAHLFLKATALGIGTIEDGKVGILSTLLPANATDVVAHNDGFLLVTVGRLQCQSLTFFILAEHILVNLACILLNQTVGSSYDELCRTVVLFQLIEA